MAQTLDSQLISIAIQNTINNPQTLQSPVSAQLSIAQSFGWTTGVALGQADRVYATQLTIAASGSQNIDLNGALFDAVGSAFNLLRVKALYVAASATNTNNVVVGGAGANTFINWVGAAAHTVIVRPGGALVLVAPDATAYGVTAGTGDILQIANSGAGSSVTANVVIVGASA